MSRVPSAGEWEALLAESKRQAVVGVLSLGLERLPADQMPPRPLVLQWVGLMQMMEATYALHCERARTSTIRAREAGFRSCVLKGIGTAQGYPSPELRQCGDIDLWVAGDWDQIMAWLRRDYVIEHVEWHHIGTKVLEDVPVEVHVHVHPSWLYNPWRNRRLQRFFDRLADAQMAERPEGFGYPDVGFNAVYSLTHTWHHLIEEGVGFRHIVDYYYILRALGAEAERSEVVRMVEQLGMRRFLAAMMYVLQEACGAPSEMLLCPPDEQEGRFLLSEMIAGGNFGQGRADGFVRNSWARWWLMVRHYSAEVLWMLPWKVWHWGWRQWNRNR